jgi:hypothetical protein
MAKKKTEEPEELRSVVSAPVGLKQTYYDLFVQSYNRVSSVPFVSKVITLEDTMNRPELIKYYQNWLNAN